LASCRNSSAAAAVAVRAARAAAASVELEPAAAAGSPAGRLSQRRPEAPAATAAGRQRRGRQAAPSSCVDPQSMREDDVETALDDCFSRAATHLAVLVGEPDAGNGGLGEQVSLCQRARHAWRENSADTGDAEDNRPHLMRPFYRLNRDWPVHWNVLMDSQTCALRVSWTSAWKCCNVFRSQCCTPGRCSWGDNQGT